MRTLCLVRGASTSMVAASRMTHAVRRIRLAAHALRPARCNRNREAAPAAVSRGSSRDSASERISVRCAQHADASPSTRAGETGLDTTGAESTARRLALPTGMGMAVVGVGAATLLLEPVRRNLPPQPEPSESMRIGRAWLRTALPTTGDRHGASRSHAARSGGAPPLSPVPRCCSKTLQVAGSVRSSLCIGRCTSHQLAFSPAARGPLFYTCPCIAPEPYGD
jgi:hypothetical protein